MTVWGDVPALLLRKVPRGEGVARVQGDRDEGNGDVGKRDDGDRGEEGHGVMVMEVAEMTEGHEYMG